MDLEQTLADIVSINSVNPAYQNGPGEAELANWIYEHFRQRGIDVWMQEVFPGRSNVVARLPGKSASRRLILEAHTDTVSIQGMAIAPFEPRVADGLMYGRGACDTKAGLAAMICAITDLHEEGIAPPSELWMAAVVDEEFAFRGVLRLCDGLKADAAIVAEPTSLRAVIASKGVLRWRIIAHGVAAHSSKPHLGVNAINQMAHVILAFEQEHKRLSGVSHPLLGPGTCNVGLINGGTQVNFVPDRCCIEIDRRLLPGELPSAVFEQYQSMLNALMREHPDMRLEMETPMIADLPLDTSADSQPAKLAERVLVSMGLDGTPCGVPFGSDASKFGRIGIPSLIFGPGSIDQAHAAIEYVELAQVHKAYQFYRSFAEQF